jgi:ABC-type taurine transport system substrate-binding protein
LGSTNHWHLARLLRAANLRLSDVDVVDMNYADMITALATGNLDAAILASPYDVQLKKDGVAEMLVPNVAPGQMLTVLMFSPQFREERPEVARRFMVGYADAIRAMQRDGDIFGDNLPIYEKYTGLRGEDILVSTPPVFDASLRIDVKPLLEYQEFLVVEKSVTYATPLTEDQLVDRSFAEYALQYASKQ